MQNKDQRRDESLANNKDAPVLTLMDTLSEKGFRYTFKVKEHGLVCIENAQRIPAQRVSLHGIYRYEGESNPDDSEIIYAVETDSGMRGVIIDAYGAYSDPAVAAFIASISDRRDESGSGAAPEEKIGLNTH